MVFAAVFEASMIFLVAITIAVLIGLVWWVARRVSKKKNSEYEKRRKIFEDQKSAKEQHSL